MRGERHLLLLLYVCRKWRGTPVAQHASALRWVRPTQLPGLDMPPADKPLLGLPEALISSFGFSAAVSEAVPLPRRASRSEAHTSELQSLMRNEYAVFCLNKEDYSVYTNITKHDT